MERGPISLRAQSHVEVPTGSSDTSPSLVSWSLRLPLAISIVFSQYVPGSWLHQLEACTGHIRLLILWSRSLLARSFRLHCSAVFVLVLCYRSDPYSSREDYWRSPSVDDFPKVLATCIFSLSMTTCTFSIRCNAQAATYTECIGTDRYCCRLAAIRWKWQSSRISPSTRTRAAATCICFPWGTASVATLRYNKSATLVLETVALAEEYLFVSLPLIVVVRHFAIASAKEKTKHTVKKKKKTIKMV